MTERNTLFVQTKVRLKHKTNELIKSYCEQEEITQSKLIEKAVNEFFKSDPEFSKKHGIQQDTEYDAITVAELEDKIFERYQVMLYIHAEQDEKIGINLESWPKCMSNYTVAKFKEKIVHRCLAKEVSTSIIDSDGKNCNARTTIRGLKEGYKSKDIDLQSNQEFYDLWNEYNESIA